MSRARLEGWRSVQERGDDGSIESDERVRVSHAVVPATESGAHELGDRYWSTVRRASFGLVRLRRAPDGSVLRLAGTPLLRFGPAELSAGTEGVSCAFPIRGGPLAGRPGGTLVLSQSSDNELRAALTGFRPRLGARVYDHMQRRIHVAISRRFFDELVGR
jgi:hypothetical protein